MSKNELLLNIYENLQHLDQDLVILENLINHYLKLIRKLRSDMEDVSTRKSKRSQKSAQTKEPSKKMDLGVESDESNTSQPLSMIASRVKAKRCQKNPCRLSSDKEPEVKRPRKSTISVVTRSRQMMLTNSIEYCQSTTSLDDLPCNSDQNDIMNAGISMSFTVQSTKQLTKRRSTETKYYALKDSGKSPLLQPAQMDAKVKRIQQRKQEILQKTFQVAKNTNVERIVRKFTGKRCIDEQTLNITPKVSPEDEILSDSKSFILDESLTSSISNKADDICSEKLSSNNREKSVEDPDNFQNSSSKSQMILSDSINDHLEIQNTDISCIKSLEKNENVEDSSNMADDTEKAVKHLSESSFENNPKITKNDCIINEDLESIEKSSENLENTANTSIAANYHEEEVTPKILVNEESTVQRSSEDDKFLRTPSVLNTDNSNHQVLSLETASNDCKTEDIIKDSIDNRQKLILKIKLKEFAENCFDWQIDDKNCEDSTFQNCSSLEKPKNNGQNDNSEKLEEDFNQLSKAFQSAEDSIVSKNSEKLEKSVTLGIKENFSKTSFDDDCIDLKMSTKEDREDFIVNQENLKNPLEEEEGIQKYLLDSINSHESIKEEISEVSNVTPEGSSMVFEDYNMENNYEESQMSEDLQNIWNKTNYDGGVDMKETIELNTIQLKSQDLEKSFPEIYNVDASAGEKLIEETLLAEKSLKDFSENMLVDEVKPNLKDKVPENNEELKHFEKNAGDEKSFNAQFSEMNEIFQGFKDPKRSPTARNILEDWCEHNEEEKTGCYSEINAENQSELDGNVEAMLEQLHCECADEIKENCSNPIEKNDENEFDNLTELAKDDSGKVSKFISQESKSNVMKESFVKNCSDLPVILEVISLNLSDSDTADMNNDYNNINTGLEKLALQNYPLETFMQDRKQFDTNCKMESSENASPDLKEDSKESENVYASTPLYEIKNNVEGKFEIIDLCYDSEEEESEHLIHILGCENELENLYDDLYDKEKDQMLYEPIIDINVVPGHTTGIFGNNKKNNNIDDTIELSDSTDESPDILENMNKLDKKADYSYKSNLEIDKHVDTPCSNQEIIGNNELKRKHIMIPESKNTLECEDTKNNAESNTYPVNSSNSLNKLECQNIIHSNDTLCGIQDTDNNDETKTHPVNSNTFSNKLESNQIDMMGKQNEGTQESSSKGSRSPNVIKDSPSSPKKYEIINGMVGFIPYVLYEIWLPDNVRPQKTVADPRLAKFSQKNKNPITPYNSLKHLPASNLENNLQNVSGVIMKTLRPEKAEINERIYKMLHQSSWYNCLVPSVKIQVNHTIKELISSLVSFFETRDLYPSRSFDIYSLDNAGEIIEILHSIGIEIDRNGQFHHYKAAPNITFTKLDQITSITEASSSATFIQSPLLAAQAQQANMICFPGYNYDPLTSKQTIMDTSQQSISSEVRTQKSNDQNNQMFRKHSKSFNNDNSNGNSRHYDNENNINQKNKQNSSYTYGQYKNTNRKNSWNNNNKHKFNYNNESSNVDSLKSSSRKDFSKSGRFLVNYADCELGNKASDTSSCDFKKAETSVSSPTWDVENSNKDDDVQRQPSPKSDVREQQKQCTADSEEECWD